MTETPKVRQNTGNMGKGRPKGSPNKITTSIKEAIVEAFDKSGGVEYLVKVAEEDPKTFCGLLGRALPLQVTGAGGGALEHEVVIRIVDSR